MIYVGTAAWNIPKAHRDRFASGDSVLEIYASRFLAVEINSSFYRPHQAKTYRRWAETVPANFRFSVKLSRKFTHDLGLHLDSASILELRKVVEDYQELGEKLGCLLVQLPPKLEWSKKEAEHFFSGLREVYLGPLALEPRHLSWMQPEVGKFYETYEVSRVWADPVIIPHHSESVFAAGGFIYYRLHGSPKIYRSSYEQNELENFRMMIQETSKTAAMTKFEHDIWCIFDNTTYGHATENALSLADKIQQDRLSSG